ncbi:MAG: hypothetical protein WBB67_03495 [bacterium]
MGMRLSENQMGGHQVIREPDGRASGYQGIRWKGIRLSENQMGGHQLIREPDGRASGYQGIRWKGIRLSENQDEGYQKIRTSGSNHYLVSWCPDIHFLIFRYPDNLFSND